MKHLDHEDLKALPYAVVGIGVGLFNVILKPAIADLSAKALSKLDIHIPTEEELNNYIRETAQDRFEEAA